METNDHMISKKRRKNEKVSKLLPEENGNSEYSNLSNSNDFSLEVQLPTLQEKQQLDEIALLKAIEQINYKIKSFKKKNLENVLEIFKNKNNDFKTERSEFDLIQQNLIIYDEIMKVMLVGDKAVGKTSFLSILGYNVKDGKETFPPENYSPTLR
jgi:hypothetical protein